MIRLTAIQYGSPMVGLFEVETIFHDDFTAIRREISSKRVFRLWVKVMLRSELDLPNQFSGMLGLPNCDLEGLFHQQMFKSAGRIIKTNHLYLRPPTWEIHPTNCSRQLPPSVQSVQHFMCNSKTLQTTAANHKTFFHNHGPFRSPVSPKKNGHLPSLKPTSRLKWMLGKLYTFLLGCPILFLRGLLLLFVSGRLHLTTSFEGMDLLVLHRQVTWENVL